jgi:hypothetical protein
MRACGTDGDNITFSGPTTLWPPNHKYRTVTITATDAQGENVSLMTTATSNEAADMIGLRAHAG